MAERQVDAFTIPKGWAGDGRSAWRQAKVNRELASLAGATSLHYADQGNYSFAFPVRTGRIQDDSQTLLWPKGHPLHPESRHEWFVAEKGTDGTWRPVAPAAGHADAIDRVKFGYLKDDPYKDDPDVAGSVAAASEESHRKAKAAFAETLSDPDGRKELCKRLGCSDEELSRMFAHVE